MNEWIKCSDRYPPECESVLIYSKGFTPISAYLVCERENAPPGWHVNDWVESNMFWSWAVVTHWMPVPAPPKEGE